VKNFHTDAKSNNFQIHKDTFDIKNLP
jgi:hypothetical protein